MSGHSHWATIKRHKQAADQKRGQLFSKLARLIAVASRQGGPDPETNPALRMAIEKAKEFSMPKDNIERAITRGSGQAAGEAQLEPVLYEGYGPGGAALLIEGITDNKNRALGEVRQILAKHGGKLADSGAVQWLFERKGIITLRMHENNTNYGITNKEKRGQLELAAIEAGAEDFSWQKQGLEVYTKPEELEKVKKGLEVKGIKPESAFLGFKPKQELEFDKAIQEKNRKLFEGLDETDTVQNIYANIKL